MVFFRRHDPQHGLSVWSTVVAPVASFVGLVVATWLVSRNFELLSGRTDRVNWLLLSVLPVAFGVGLLRTLWLRGRKPAAYRALTETRVF